MKQPETNEEKVQSLMWSNEFGPLAEIVMIQVINVGLNNVLKGIDESTDSTWNLINKESFKACAEEMSRRFNEYYA